VNTYKRALIAVPVVLASVLAVGVSSASASHKGNCVGTFASTFNQIGKQVGVPGVGGRIVSFTAPVNELASSDCAFED
jgi:hypothetical protein